MRASLPSLHGLVAGLAALCVWSLSPLLPPGYAEAPSSAPSGSSGKRWVKIDLVQGHAPGGAPWRTPFDLSVEIGGVVQGSAPVVAVCDSPAFQRQMVMLAADERPLVMKGLLSLEPVPGETRSVPSTMTRVQITIARLKGNKMERMLSREVFLLSAPPAAAASRDAGGEPPPPAPALLEGEVQPDVVPIATDVLEEEDLVSAPGSGSEQGYWQQVTELVNRSWSKTVRQIPSGSAGSAVGIAFKLYPDGRVPLVQIEQASGAREVDEAGVQAIAQAQPFPSFSGEVASEAVDVHVRLRVGSKASGRDVRSVGIQSPLAPGAGGAVPKK